MNASSIDVGSMLEVESGLGLVMGTNMFIGKTPANPPSSVTLFDTSSIPPKLGFNKEDVYDKPAVQVRVRATDYVTGWNLINNIKNVLHNKGNETWGGSFYTVIYCASGPAQLDWDESGRARFICNFQMQRR